MTSPIPDDRMPTRVALIIAIIVVAVGIVAMGAWAVFRPHPKAVAQRGFTPAQETSSAATPATASVVASAATSAESSGTTSAASGGTAAASGGEGAAARIVRAPKVVFRLGQWVYVADEDGGSSRAVTQSVDAQLSLSPDGRTLALARTGSITLYEVDGGKLVYSGAAEAVRPVWLPDSSAVMFMRVGVDGAAQVYRVSGTGGLEVLLGTGSDMAVSPNGEVVALLPASGSTPTPKVLVSRGGAEFTPVSVSGGDPIGIALGDKRLYVSTISAAEGAAIWSLGLDGSDKRQLVKPGSTAEKGATFGRMLPSPDGVSLLYAAESDDGYSRMFVVPAAGGTPFSLSSRRDNYPLLWSVSGKDILFIEGNAFQGESTALYHVSPTGTRRLMVVSGAGL